MDALIELGRYLSASGYRFATVTPETHRRVNARPENARARTLRDVFGWSRPFDPGVVPAGLLDCMREADALLESDSGLRSAVRFSSLQDRLFVHSAFPTADTHSVFFGPDTYRFCSVVERVAKRSSRVVDIGCGSGAGGIVAASAADEVVLADVNPLALRYAQVNARLAATQNVEIMRSDVLAQVVGPMDLVIANPPYMRDDLARTYRDGGGLYGEGLALRIVREATERLARRGTLILYTGAAIVDGEDTFHRGWLPLLTKASADFRYEELDPDVFGEELDRPQYAAVERIAAVVLVASWG
jgi:release factor glutamine methyltransferase